MPVKKTLEGSSGVSISVDEIQAALEAIKAQKEWELEKERRRKEAEAIDAEIRRPWKPSDQLAYLRHRATMIDVAFAEDETNDFAIKALCHYFTNSPAFAGMSPPDQKWSLEKGILLSGTVGTGKTTLMRLFAMNKKKVFHIMPCRKIASIFADKGHEILHQYDHPKIVPPSRDTFFQEEIGICFDDLGTEGVKKSYGNQVNVMEEVLLNRYDSGATPHTCTHITTNLTADEIEQYYGTRVRSRMREMFNMITLNGNDRRS